MGTSIITFFIGCIPACLLELYLLKHSKEKRTGVLSVLVMCLSVLIVCAADIKIDNSEDFFAVLGFVFPIFVAALLHVSFKR